MFSTAMQVQQAAQAVMETKNWSIVIEAGAVILSAFGAAAMTLYWQRRKEKRDAKLNVFLNLMMHRKADPPNQMWVNALNIIDVAFHDESDVIESWHKLYPILHDEAKVNTEEHHHAYIHMLSKMAGALNYPNLQQIDIDKFYSPPIYAVQAAVNAQIQGEIMAFFKSALVLLAAKQGETAKPPIIDINLGIITPEDNMSVARKHDVIGYVYPSAANVQVLVFSGDNLWYPQTPILRDEAKWKVLATFGNEKAAPGRSFRIIAIVSSTEISQPIKQLPANAIKSNVVTVTTSKALMQPPPL